MTFSTSFHYIYIGLFVSHELNKPTNEPRKNSQFGKKSKILSKINKIDANHWGTLIEITVNGDATEKGFTWVYKVTNPSSGKIYWSVIPSDGKIMTFEDIENGLDSNNCFGLEQQVI